MKSLNIAIIVMAAIATVTPAAAQTTPIGIPAGAAPVGKPLSRAEVLADLHMWQLAGMQEFYQTEIRFANEEGYREAYARYRDLIASPAYPVLVEQLRANPSMTVVRR
jgi:hypothetical protein